MPAGTEGELVFTTITKEGFPLIRYRTGDLGVLSPRAVPVRAGRFSRMSRVLGRIDDLIIMGAVEDLPVPDRADHPERAGAGAALRDHPGPGERRIDTLEVRVEISEAMPGMDEMKTLERAKARLAQEIDTAVGIQARVTLVEPRKIARQTEGKQRRVVDRRRM